MPPKTRPHKPPKRTLLRWTLLLLGGLVALLVVVVVSFFLINTYDPPIDVAAAAAINTSPPPLPDAENSYFANFGLGVAANQDPHRYGVELVTKHNAWMRDHGQELRDQEVLMRMAREALEAMKTPEALPWRSDARVLCPEPRLDCLAAYAKQRSKIRTLVANNPVRLARYRSLYRYRYFHETMTEDPYHVISPSIYLAGFEHETVLAEIGLAALDGNVAKALHDLSEDTAYWRRVLAGAGILLPKLVAAAFLDRNYALLSEIAVRYRNRTQVFAAADPMMTPLSAEERSWRGPFISEFRRQADLFLSLPTNNLNVGAFDMKMKALDWLPGSLLYKPHATVNLLYRQYQSLLVIGVAAGDEFLEAVQHTRDVTAATVRIPRLDMVYNPVGKVWLAFMPPADAYPHYVTRVHNLDGRMRLVHLQLDIYRRRISLDEIESYLQQSPAELRDPYRKKPMCWDAAKRELWFEGINKRDRSENMALDYRIATRL